MRLICFVFEVLNIWLFVVLVMCCSVDVLVFLLYVMGKMCIGVFVLFFFDCVLIFVISELSEVVELVFLLLDSIMMVLMCFGFVCLFIVLYVVRIVLYSGVLLCCVYWRLLSDELSFLLFVFSVDMFCSIWRFLFWLEEMLVVNVYILILLVEWKWLRVVCVFLIVLFSWECLLLMGLFIDFEMLMSLSMDDGLCICVY